mmetsp:Transcript_19414/g.29089  ORF Transcript_19414/g.29089 Transcript_19414/m.29089 type:complete len:217 (+) Transcript_19414:280-930(+)
MSLTSDNAFATGSVPLARDGGSYPLGGSGLLLRLGDLIPFFSNSSSTPGGLSLSSLATIISSGRGEIFMSATVSLHIILVKGRRKSTPAASRMISPGFISPRRVCFELGVSGATVKTRMTPSCPRLSLMPIASVTKSTFLSIPTRKVAGRLGICFENDFGIGGTLVVVFNNSCLETNLGGLSFGIGLSECIASERYDLSSSNSASPRVLLFSTAFS